MISPQFIMKRKLKNKCHIVLHYLYPPILHILLICHISLNVSNCVNFLAHTSRYSASNPEVTGFIPTCSNNKMKIVCVTSHLDLDKIGADPLKITEIDIIISTSSSWTNQLQFKKWQIK